MSSTGYYTWGSPRLGVVPASCMVSKWQTEYGVVNNTVGGYRNVATFKVPVLHVDMCAYVERERLSSIEFLACLGETMYMRTSSTYAPRPVEAPRSHLSLASSRSNQSSCALRLSWCALSGNPGSSGSCEPVWVRPSLTRLGQAY